MSSSSYRDPRTPRVIEAACFMLCLLISHALIYFVRALTHAAPALLYIIVVGIVMPLLTIVAVIILCEKRRWTFGPSLLALLVSLVISAVHILLVADWWAAD